MSAVSGWMIFIGTFWIAAAVGVGLDARKYGGNGVKWFMIVLITGIFGLAFYAIAHRNTPPTQYSQERVLLVRGEVIEVETGENQWVKLSVKSDSMEGAIHTFKEECRDKGYQPINDPKIIIK